MTQDILKNGMSNEISSRTVKIAKMLILIIPASTTLFFISRVLKLLFLNSIMHYGNYDKRGYQ